MSEDATAEDIVNISTQSKAFDTIIDVRVWARDEGEIADTRARLEGALTHVQEMCARYEVLFSRTIPSSSLSRINDAHGEAVHVEPEVAQLIETSLRYSEATQGLFDITMGTVTPLWNFHEGIVPAREALDEALSHVDWRGVEIQGRTVRLRDPATRLDLGGIAKGYIADGLIGYLKGCDLGGAYVNLGGNVVVMGRRPDGSDWTVGLRDSRDPRRIVAVLRAPDISVVTSGVYERRFERDGIEYHHILSPKTGMPAVTDIEGITVVSSESIDGDGYSTGLLMMGVDRALEFAEATEGIEVFIIDRDRQFYLTEGLMGYGFALVE